MAENNKLSGSIKPIKNGWARLFNHKVLRWVIQIGVLAFITFIIVQHVVIGENGLIVTPSPEAFCPFGGLETLYKYLTQGGSFVSHVHLSNVVIFIAVMALALLLRSAFCGWICPLGTIQDLVNRFSKYLQKKVPVFRKAMASLRKRSARLAVLDRYLRYVKYLVLVWAVGGAAAFGFMVFRDFDPWSALINIAEFSFTPGFVVLVVLLVASFFVERPWCRYACPLGAVSGLVGKLSPVYLKREESACTSCGICSRSCPMGLPVHTATTIKSVDCISCLECVGSCPRNGALEVKVGLPLIGK
jgi:polyferredoxin